MTGDEVIELARTHFGELEPTTISEAAAETFLNAAIKEMYEDLPNNRKRHLYEVDTLPVTDGRGELDPTWDHILEVYLNGEPAYFVSREVIQNTSYGSGELFTSVIPLFYIDDRKVWVRPKNAEVRIVHLEPPEPITNFTIEITAFPKQWHAALASLIASYMYAQEEDLAQAQHYRSEYQSRIFGLAAQAEAESAS